MNLLDRETIVELLTQLGARLARRGLEAELYVVGGTAMALAYNRTKVTTDIDAIFEPVAEVEAEARAMARDRRDLPDDWLNSKVKPLLPVLYDQNQVEAISAPGISVNVASPEHLLAMKVRAARDDRDLQDVLALVRILNLRSMPEVWAIADAVWTTELITPESRFTVTEYLLHYGLHPA